MCRCSRYISTLDLQAIPLLQLFKDSICGEAVKNIMSLHFHCVCFSHSLMSSLKQREILWHQTTFSLYFPCRQKWRSVKGSDWSIFFLMCFLFFSLRLYIQMGVKNESKWHCSLTFCSMCCHNCSTLLLVWSSVVSFAFYTHDLLEFMSATPTVRRANMDYTVVIHSCQVHKQLKGIYFIRAARLEVKRSQSQFKY